MAVTISGMFGAKHTYFAGSPVVIDISDLEWQGSSPFTVVRLKVIRNGKVKGEFPADTGGQTSASFDISSALRAIWSDIDFSAEVAAAQLAADANDYDMRKAAQGGDIDSEGYRNYREYSLVVSTEYIDSTDGELATREYGPFEGGRCMIGELTEWERSLITDKSEADASHWEDTNPNNGDASTKPTNSPERVGSDSITSWVDVANNGTLSVFYPAGTYPGGDTNPHPPLVLRDSIPYIDFLFVNRRGAVETCSALMKEQMSITAETTEYACVERPTFKPSRSLMTISSGGRRSWSMSSGKQTREWLEWWVMEFLPARKKWMRWKGPGTDKAIFVPVTVKPAKKSIDIYDRSKQQMESVEFTVTLGLEG